MTHFKTMLSVITVITAGLFTACPIMTSEQQQTMKTQTIRVLRRERREDSNRMFDYLSQRRILHMERAFPRSLDSALDVWVDLYGHRTFGIGLSTTEGESE